ncbi:MAG: type II secretion system protein [Candidatus Caccosoma sp.]|nr:type II secretion system protein [Candidatus Caccosoma sp.]
MKKKIKKAFTLVELLVVIAILAILATVSIVGYNSFTKKARVSNDTVLVKQMNDILFANKQTDDANPTMTKALEDVFDGGYDLTKLTPTTTGYSIVWDSKNDQMVLLDDSSTKEPVYPEASKVSEKKDLFIITRNKTEFDDTKEFAHYLAESFEVSDIETSTGIDTGRNENVKNVKYKNSNKQDAIIRTNSGTLTIDASTDNVYHYGLASKVVIDSVAQNSYHENGYVTSYLEVKDGHVVLEKNSSVSILAVNGSTVSVEQKANSELFKVVPVGSSTIDNNKIKVSNTVVKGESIESTQLNNMKYGGGTGESETSAFELHTASHLAAFAKDVNSGSFDEKYVYAKLCSDVDISGMGWEPIGTVEHSFLGSFDGGAHTINGLTNIGYSPSYKLFGTTNTAKNYGMAYGFFGVVGDMSGSNNDKEMLFKDVKFVNVNINSSNANMLGVLIGADTNAAKNASTSVNSDLSRNITINNVTVNGTIKCNNKSGATVSGIAGKIYTKGNVEVTNCTNNANIVVNGEINKVAGILGLVQYFNTLTVDNCVNTGNIVLNSYVGYVSGILCYGSGIVATMNVTNNTNKGNIKNEMVDGSNYGDKTGLANSAFYYNTTYIMCCASGSLATSSKYNFTGNKNEDGIITVSENKPTNFTEILININQSSYAKEDWNGKTGTI